MEEVRKSETSNLNPESVSIMTEILDEYTFNRKHTEEYVKQKHLEQQVLSSAEALYLNNTIFPLLKDALVEMLTKVKEDDSFYRNNSTLNGLDFLSEILYNRNPNHPDRQRHWTYIFDLQWVQDYLTENPRPCYKFHLVWSKNFAALKIQSFIRGHWVRCRPEVQELRQFWRVISEYMNLIEVK